MQRCLNIQHAANKILIITHAFVKCYYLLNMLLIFFTRNFRTFFIVISNFCNMYRNTWLRSVCVGGRGIKNNNNIHALNSTEESFHTCQIVTESAGQDTEGRCFVFQRLHGQYHQLTEQVDRNIAKNCPLLVLFDQHL